MKLCAAFQAPLQAHAKRFLKMLTFKRTILYINKNCIFCAQAKPKCKKADAKPDFYRKQNDANAEHVCGDATRWKEVGIAIYYSTEMYIADGFKRSLH